MAILPFDDRDGTIWYDGQMLPWREAKTHVLTHGLHYGSCVFEGQRAYEGEVFKLEEHTDRLFKSAEIMGMKIPYTPAEINRACREVLASAGYANAYMRPVAFRGSEMMAVSAQQTKTHVAIATWEWPRCSTPRSRPRASSSTSRAGAAPRPTPHPATRRPQAFT